MTISDINGKTIPKDDLENPLQQHFFAKKTGNYEICLENHRNAMMGCTFNFQIKTGVHANDYRVGNMVTKQYMRAVEMQATMVRD